MMLFATLWLASAAILLELVHRAPEMADDGR
jgi:hypothetical protein